MIQRNAKNDRREKRLIFNFSSFNGWSFKPPHASTTPSFPREDGASIAGEQLSGEWNICVSEAHGKQTFCPPYSTRPGLGSKQLATRCVRAKCRPGLRQASCPLPLPFHCLARCKSLIKVDVVGQAFGAFAVKNSTVTRIDGQVSAIEVPEQRQHGD
ncbi:hypothetical protein K0M31_012675 [Melipona bicolor]|uniref:Uncharacterized protein n=1 Tax=Melipona bicolor TaxID=60889 RepID=A0AA40FJ96_9HYME|nr:hypothetical protein K0M31_012675 [Melipona bicolor]